MNPRLTVLCLTKELEWEDAILAVRFAVCSAGVAGLPPVKIRYFEKFQFFNILIEKNGKIFEI